MRVAAPFLGGTMRRYTVEEVECLKALVERSAAVDQASFARRTFQASAG